MKKLVIIMIVAILLNPGSNILTAQNYHDTSVNNNLKSSTAGQYLKKSHDQKKAATFMAIGGGAILLTGMALTLSSLSHLFEPGNNADYGSAPDILSIGGGALCVGSFILLHASKKNKRLAELSMRTETLRVAIGKRNGIASLSFKIGF
jgi:hypothetical protein